MNIDIFTVKHFASQKSPAIFFSFVVGYRDIKGESVFCFLALNDGEGTGDKVLALRGKPDGYTTAGNQVHWVSQVDSSSLRQASDWDDSVAV